MWGLGGSAGWKRVSAWGVSVQGVSARGVSDQGDVCLWGLPRGCPRGVSVQAGCLRRGVSAQGGVSTQGCVSARHPSVDRMTDRCKNITLPHLRCGR